MRGKAGHTSKSAGSGASFRWIVWQGSTVILIQRLDFLHWPNFSLPDPKKQLVLTKQQHQELSSGQGKWNFLKPSWKSYKKSIKIRPGKLFKHICQ